MVAGGWLAAGFTGHDDSPGPVEALLLEKARQQDALGVADVDEDDDPGAGGPDPFATGVGDDDARAHGSIDVGRAPADDDTGTRVEDRLRHELVRARGESDALRRQLATERRRDDTGGVVGSAEARGGSAARAPAPSPTPPRAWRGGGDSDDGGSDT